MIRFILNEKEIETNQPPGMVLLDFIRYQQHLSGTKIGCREGDCGACSVLKGRIVNDELYYETVTSCLAPLGSAAGCHIVTVEGINFPGKLNPIQQAMADEGATQCGFCTPGFVMSFAGFCLNNKEANNQNAIAAVDGNICRCTGYKSIERAAAGIALLLKEKNGEVSTTYVSRKKILPEYFAGMKDRLRFLLNAGPTTHASQPTSQLVGGGTDLYVQKHEEMTHADIRFVVDDPERNKITKDGNKCVMEPSVTVTDMMNSSIISEVFPDFHRYAKLISSTPIRNMATIAGNFVNASPIGDFTIFFLALDAQIDLTPNPSPRGGEGGIRTLPLRKLYKGYKQLDLEPGEIISKIWFEIPGKNSPKESLRSYFNFEKVSKRTHLDIASVNSAILLNMNGEIIENAGLSAGGVGPLPMYLKKTSEFFKGKTLRQVLDKELVKEAIEIMKTEISPISDARGSKEYKTLLLGQLIKAHFISLIPIGE